jgi:thiol-disulfide isomerase/thioredoxin
MSRRDWLSRYPLLFAGPARQAARPAAETGAVGAPSPPLRIQTLDGKVIDVHKQAGKVVLVDFMTTTCPSCKQASEGIQKLYQELGGKGFLPVAVAIDPQAGSMLPFYRNLYSLTFPLALLPREDVLKYLNHPADRPMYVPTLVLLDKRGRISRKQVGWPGEQELRTAIAELLNKKT